MTPQDVSAGDRASFGIESRICGLHDPYVFGPFLLWCGGECLGDPEDEVPLNGCRNWAADLAVNEYHTSDSYFDADLVSLARRLLYHSTVTCEDGKFDLTYLGMTGLLDHGDAVSMVRSSSGAERLLWRRARSDEARELVLAAGTVEGVVSEWVLRFDNALRGLRRGRARGS